MERTITWHSSGQTIKALIDSKDGTLYFYSKRGLDVVLATLLLIILLPFLIFIAILIRLDSSGPILYVQKRVGVRRRRSKNGETIWEIRNFPFYKFRSMIHNADQSVHQKHIKAFVNGNLNTAEANGQVKLVHDSRVTRVGRIIRTTSLDELPQLINVLKGDMSLVGPRPVPTYEVAEYEAWHYTRLAALPGITGLWQVKGRGVVTFEEMIQMDLEYIHNQSLRSDLKILLLTIPVVLSGRGAG
ncbi:MAG: sugar transferase [Phycisphaerae bacterium]|nr:sugar transferase [Phycisphaerae bacterium]NIW44588.1 sugar transferase [Gammaproteobacteria bacterium]NIX31813.1 sugar transferase [Phycisphaerae bacterium]